MKILSRQPLEDYVKIRLFEEFNKSFTIIVKIDC